MRMGDVIMVQVFFYYYYLWGNLQREVSARVSLYSIDKLSSCRAKGVLGKRLKTFL